MVIIWSSEGHQRAIRGPSERHARGIRRTCRPSAIKYNQAQSGGIRRTCRPSPSLRSTTIDSSPPAHSTARRSSSSTSGSTMLPFETQLMR